jgi:Family of unknown function (DUF6340)
MKKTLNLVFASLMVLALTSCKSVLYYKMDVLRPGYIVTSPDKRSVLLVDNSTTQPPEYGHQIIANIYKRDTSYNIEPFSKDFMEFVSKYLIKEDYYSQIQISNKTDKKSKSIYNDDFLRSKRLTYQQVKALSNSGDFDILISLDRSVLFSKTRVSNFYDSFRATRDVTINTVWRAYDIHADSILTQFQFTDSLYWEKFSYSPILAMKDLPAFEKTLPEIADVFAEHVSKLLGPYWESVERPYFCSGSFRMKFAADCMQNNDWEGAVAFWRTEVEKGFGRSVYRAAMNMMLYYEYKGKPDEALVWAGKAEKLILRSPFDVPAFDKDLFRKWSKSLQISSLEYQKLKIYFDGRLN